MVYLSELSGGLNVYPKEIEAQIDDASCPR